MRARPSLAIAVLLTCLLCRVLLQTGVQVFATQARTRLRPCNCRWHFPGGLGKRLCGSVWPIRMIRRRAWLNHLQVFIFLTTWWLADATRASLLFLERAVAHQPVPSTQHLMPTREPHAICKVWCSSTSSCRLLAQHESCTSPWLRMPHLLCTEVCTGCLAGALLRGIQVESFST